MNKNSPKVYFFNDTSRSNHAGCKAVMRSLHYVLRNIDVIESHYVHELTYNRSAMNECDVVFVNGEGTIHHHAPAGDFLMDMLALGQKLGKKTMLVNAVFQQEPPYYPDVLAKLDYFSAREPFSAENAIRSGGSPVVLLDSCADQRFLNGKPIAQFEGIVKGDVHPVSPSAGMFLELPYPFFGLDCSFEDFVATLQNITLYITGQHHGVYGAGLAGIPFIAVPSNSHKIESLIAWSGLPIPICYSVKEINSAINWAWNNKEIYKEFQRFLFTNKVYTEDMFWGALKKNYPLFIKEVSSGPLTEWQLPVMPLRPQPELVRVYDETSLDRKLIGSTGFFRNRPLFRTILDNIDPSRDVVQVLFHASSIGCDPVSFCVAFNLYFRGRKKPELNVYSVDISGQFLARAQAGCYPEIVLEGMIPEERAYFALLDDGLVRIKSSILDQISFLPPGSFVDFTSSMSFDIVFLLNALCYVPSQDQARTIDNIAAYNNGLLVITAYHEDTIKSELSRNGYMPVTENLELIYNSWECRLSLPSDCMIDGLTYHTPALKPFQPREDNEFLCGSLFVKENNYSKYRKGVPVNLTPVCPPNRLADIVANRPLVILLHGKSIAELEDKIVDFSGRDVCWCSMNFFGIMEERILHKIGKKLDVVFCSSRQEIINREQELRAFLQRDDDNVLVSTAEALSNVPSLLDYAHKIVTVAEPRLPERLMPNSLTLLIEALVTRGGADKLILFGADGLLATDVSVASSYFGGEVLAKQNREWLLVNDTVLFNSRFPVILNRELSRKAIPPPCILNCSPGSVLTPFPIINYKDVLRLLEGELSWPLIPVRTEEVDTAPTKIVGECCDYLIVMAGRRYFLVHDRINVENGSLDNLTDIDAYEHHGICIECISIDAAKDVAGMLTRAQTMLLEQHRGFNVIQHKGFIIAAANELGEMDFSDLGSESMKLWQDQGLVYLAPSVRDMRVKLDQSGYEPSPLFVEENVAGYSVVKLGYKYLALSHQLGPIDPKAIDINDYQTPGKEHLVYIDDNLESVIEMVKGAKRMPVKNSMTEESSKYHKVILNDNKDISTAEYEKACEIAGKIKAIDRDSESWLSTSGTPVYGKLIGDSILNLDYSVINHLRLNVWQFSGYRLTNVLHNEKQNSWTDTIKGDVPQSLLEGCEDWSIGAFLQITKDIPDEFICKPPIKLGEVGWLVNGGLVNRDILAYQERIALLYKSGILTEMKRRGPVNIVEIGGGYGALAHFIKKILPEANYYIVDLPKSLLFSAIYLNLANESSKSLIYSGDSSESLSEQRDFTFIPNYMFDNLAGMKFDLAINTLSFAEMPDSTVESYVRGLAQLLGDSGYLFEQNFDNSHYGIATFCNPLTSIREYFKFGKNIDFRARWGKAHLWSNTPSFPESPRNETYAGIEQVPRVSSINSEKTHEATTAGKEPLFSFLIPTRGRPDLVARLFQSIVDTTSNLADLEIILVIDDDDELSKGIRDERINFKIVVVPKGLSMGALNQACYRASSGRYIMLMNDDVVLRTPGWDRVVLGAFTQFRDDIALIHVNDLLFRERLCTFPFLSRIACEMVGLCPDVYQRYKIDDHIYEIYSMLAHLGHKRIIYLPDVIFEHENHAAQAGPDASEQHVFVSQDNKMYVPHGPTIEKDDRAFTERNNERKKATLELAAHIEGHRIQAQHESKLGMFADKLSAIKEPYSFRKPGFLTVQPGKQHFSSITHRTTVAVTCSDIRKEMTQRCIATIKDHTDNYDLIVLDNAGSREFSHPSEMNKVLKSVTTDFLVLMDDDVFVDPGWLDGLLKCIDDKTAVVAPVHRGKAPFTGAYLMGDGRGTHAHTIDMPSSPREMQCYCSAIILIDVRKAGHILMEEKYNKYFFDLVHGFMVWEAGYRSVCTPEVVVTHVGGGTMNWGTSTSNQLVEADRQNFVADWIDSGRLTCLEQGIWKDYPYLMELLQIPKRIKRLGSELSNKSSNWLLNEINEIWIASENKELFRNLLNDELAQSMSASTIAQTTDAPHILVALGERLCDLGFNEAALVCMKNALEADRDCIEAWIWISVIAKKMNDPKLFTIGYEQAASRNPNHQLLLQVTG